LIKQSWAPKEMAEAVLNADGFGFGWYSDINDPMIYLNTLPIWSDINLESLAGHCAVKSGWVVCVVPPRDK
ncbi:MAG: class II glutamine amidotransferase, partial [Gammaproteobacteria bacterium]